MARENDAAPGRLPIGHKLGPSAGGILFYEIGQQLLEPVQDGVDGIDADFLADRSARHDSLAVVVEAGAVKAVRAGNGNHVVLVVQADRVVAPLGKGAVDRQTSFCFAPGADEKDEQPMG